MYCDSYALNTNLNIFKKKVLNHEGILHCIVGSPDQLGADMIGLMKLG